MIMSNVSPSGVMNMSLSAATALETQILKGMDHLGLVLDDLGDKLAQSHAAGDLDLRFEHGLADTAAPKLLGQENADLGHVPGIVMAQVQRRVADDTIADHRDQGEDACVIHIFGPGGHEARIGHRAAKVRHLLCGQGCEQGYEGIAVFWYERPEQHTHPVLQGYQMTIKGQLLGGFHSHVLPPAYQPKCQQPAAHQRARPALPRPMGNAPCRCAAGTAQR